MKPEMQTMEEMTLEITQEMRVEASLETTFDALLEQIGPGNETPDGKAMPFKIEAWPGGRWYRDLGDGNGHCWGYVQAVKRPSLLEFHGPLFMSLPVVSNVQYRLTEVEGGTLITFRHTALGLLPPNAKANMTTGWNHMLMRARDLAQAQRTGKAAAR